MDIECLEFDLFNCADLEAQKNKFDSVLQEVHSTKAIKMRIIQSSQDDIEEKQNLNLNQFPSQQQQTLVHSNNTSPKPTNIKPSKPRKKRTALNLDLIEQMNSAFESLQSEDSSPFKNELTLKKIAEKLNLSEVTVLRKYRQFKQYRVVIKSPSLQTNKNRSSKKIQEINQLIEECLKSRNFYTAPQLAQYIKAKYGKQFSRFQILYCWKKINCKKSNMQNTVNRDNSRKIIIENYSIFEEDNIDILFFGEVNCFTKDLTLINIFLICGEKGLQFVVKIKDERSNQLVFEQLIDTYFEKYGKIDKWVLVTGENQLYKQTTNEEKQNSNAQSLLQTIISKNGEVHYLPAESQTLNLAKSILIRSIPQFYKPEKNVVDYVATKLKTQKRHYSRKGFIQCTNQLKKKAVSQQNLFYN